MVSNIYLIYVVSIRRNGVVQVKYLLMISINTKIMESLIGTIDFDFSSI